jgi:AAA+ superfamily predicted ATPase
MVKVLYIELNSDWILENRGSDELPIDTIIRVVKENYTQSVKVKVSDLTSCILEIETEESKDYTKQEVTNLIQNNLKLDDVDNILKLICSEITDDLLTLNESIDAVSSQDSLTAIVEKTSKVQAIDKINSLIGAEEFKRLSNQLVALAPVIEHNKTHEIFAFQNYLFSVNDGYGLSTYLELFVELIEELKLFKFTNKKRVEEIKISFSKDNSVQYYEILNKLSMMGRGSQLVCIDLSNVISNLNDKTFKSFLLDLEDLGNNHIFVFRVPFIEKNILSDIKTVLADVLFVREVTFVPMDNDELIKCANSALNKYNYEIEQDVWQVFNTRISEEKSDGRFYGINTVNKIVKEMIYLKHISDMNSNNIDKLIKKEDILELALNHDSHDVSGIEMLNNLVGIDEIKGRVLEIVAQINLALSNSIEKPCLHMRFVGNPGTGKTTIARIMGKILKENGVLRNGHFFEKAGRDLCGSYVGHTAPKTAEICRDAYGSVLFIDEAYSLYKGKEMEFDYGREALDTLISEMENHRTDLVVIMAGYPDEMEILLKGNSGLASRIPYLIHFPNYSRETLFTIFMNLIKRDFRYTSEFEEVVRDYFNNLSESFLVSKEFSNARFARNLFERTWGKAAMRKQLDRSDEFMLKAEDFAKATSDNEFKNMLSKKQKQLGFY